MSNEMLKRLFSAQLYAAAVRLRNPGMQVKRLTTPLP